MREKILGFRKSLGFSYMYYVITSIIMYIWIFQAPSVTANIWNVPYLTFTFKQIWRLFLSFYAIKPNLYDLIGAIFCLIWLYRLLNQQRKSTIYIFWEIITFQITIHLAFSTIFYFIMNQIQDSILNSLSYTLLTGEYLDTNIYSHYEFILKYGSVGYGWYSIIIFYEFQKAREYPGKGIKLLCTPWTLKNKFIPYILFIVFLFYQRIQGLCIVTAFFIGLIQQKCLKFNIIKLPYKFYACCERMFPQCLVQSSFFTTVASKSRFVRSHSLCQAQAQQSRMNHAQQQIEGEIQQRACQIHGKGVQLGTGSSNEFDFKSHWGFNKQSDHHKQQHKKQQNFSPSLQNTDKIQKDCYIDDEDMYMPQPKINLKMQHT